MDIFKMQGFKFDQIDKKDFNWSNEYEIQFSERLKLFFELPLHNTDNELRVEDIESFYDIIIYDFVNELLIHNLDGLRKFFWTKRNRQMSPKYFSEVFYSTSDEFYNAAKKVFNTTHGNRIFNESFKAIFNEKAHDFSETIPKLLLPIYLYGLTYSIDNLGEDFGKVPSLMKKRIMPISKGKLYHSNRVVAKKKSGTSRTFKIIKKHQDENISMIQLLNDLLILESEDCNVSFNYYYFDKITNFITYNYFLWGVIGGSNVDFKKEVRKNIESKSNVFKIRGLAVRKFIIKEVKPNKYSDNEYYWDIYDSVIQKMIESFEDYIISKRLKKNNNADEKVELLMYIYQNFFAGIDKFDQEIKDTAKKLAQTSFSADVYESGYKAVANFVSKYRSDRNITAEESKKWKKIINEKV